MRHKVKRPLRIINFSSRRSLARRRINSQPPRLPCTSLTKAGRAGLFAMPWSNERRSSAKENHQLLWDNSLRTKRVIDRHDAVDSAMRDDFYLFAGPESCCQSRRNDV